MSQVEHTCKDIQVAIGKKGKQAFLQDESNNQYVYVDTFAFYVVNKFNLKIVKAFPPGHLQYYKIYSHKRA